MFCLPNIKRLNDEAASREIKREIEDLIANPQVHPCQVCQWHDINRQADYAHPFHDIYSNDAKGVLFVCDEHEGYGGEPYEGYFRCEKCDRVLVENYSWEMFFVYVEEHGTLCLPCALKTFIANHENWVDPRRVKNADFVDFEERIFIAETGTLNLAAIEHLIGVRMPIPKSLVFYRNVEFDGLSKCELATTMSTFGPGHGEHSVLSVIEEIAEQGYTECLVILDAVYQFAASIGVYVSAEEHCNIAQAHDVQDDLEVAA